MQFLYHMGMWYSNLGDTRSPLAAVTITSSDAAGDGHEQTLI
jgi:hypothetical protein